LAAQEANAITQCLFRYIHASHISPIYNAYPATTTMSSTGADNLPMTLGGSRSSSNYLAQTVSLNRRQRNDLPHTEQQPWSALVDTRPLRVLRGKDMVHSSLQLGHFSMQKTLDSRCLRNAGLFYSGLDGWQSRSSRLTWAPTSLCPSTWCGAFSEGDGRASDRVRLFLLSELPLLLW
jgi:hypothetical protein